MKSVSPEEVSGASVTVDEPVTRHETTDREAQEAQEAWAPSASSRDQPDFNPEQIRSYIQNIKEQYDEYSQAPKTEDAKKHDAKEVEESFIDDVKKQYANYRQGSETQGEAYRHDSSIQDNTVNDGNRISNTSTASLVDASRSLICFRQARRAKHRA
jgi:hypothetical protein